MSDFDNRRKKYLLNPNFQLKLMGYFMALSFAMITIFYGSVLFFFWKFHDMGVELGLQESHVFFRFLAQQKSQMNWIFLATSIIGAIALTVGGLVLSHKIAGPIHRLCTWLDEKRNGKQSEPLKFREGDFFPEIESHVNELVDFYEEKKKDKAA